MSDRRRIRMMRLGSGRGVAWLSEEGAAVFVSEAALEAVIDAGVMGEPFKDDGRSRVWRSAADGGRWVVKRYELPRWKAVVYGGARRSVGWREWRAAEVLKDHGVRVLEPAALIQRPSGDQVVVLRYVASVSVINWVTGERDPSVWPADYRERRLRVAYEIGRQFGLLAKRGFYNRDANPANLLVPDDGGESIVIDGMVRRMVSYRSLFRGLAAYFDSVMEKGVATRGECRAAVDGLREAGKVFASRYSRREVMRRVVAELRAGKKARDRAR